MAGTEQQPYPDQVPRFAIPGAEYLALAPNAHVAISSRRRRFVTAGPITVAPDTNATLSANLEIESGFVPGSGIWLIDLQAPFTPGDASGEIQILSYGVALNVSGSGFAYWIGNPIATTLSPASGVNLISDRDKLILQRDVAFFDNPSNGTLNLDVISVVTNNDPSVSHTAQFQAFLVYSRIDGATE